MMAVAKILSVIIFLLFLVVAGLMFFVGSLKSERHDLGVRLSVYAQADGETVVFSETYSIAVYLRPELLSSFDGASISAKTIGEAITVQIGDQIVFAGISESGAHPGGALERAHRELFIKTTRGAGYGAWLDVAPGLTEEIVVPRAYWPKFYAFGNAEDPKTAYLVEPEDLTWVTIDRVTVQATSQTPDMGDDLRALPWLAQMQGGSICLDYVDEWRAGGPKLPCLTIVKPNFIDEPKAS